MNIFDENTQMILISLLLASGITDEHVVHPKTHEGLIAFVKRFFSLGDKEPNEWKLADSAPKTLCLTVKEVNTLKALIKKLKIDLKNILKESLDHTHSKVNSEVYFDYFFSDMFWQGTPTVFLKYKQMWFDLINRIIEHVEALEESKDRDELLKLLEQNRDCFRADIFVETKYEGTSNDEDMDWFETTFGREGMKVLPEALFPKMRKMLEKKRRIHQKKEQNVPKELSSTSS